MLNKNCWDLPCKYADSDLDTLICMHHQCDGNKEVSEFLKDCDKFEMARTCLDCKYSRPVVYGAIGDGDECTDYFCPFIEEGKKLVYSDCRSFSTHYSDIPECPCDRFQFHDNVHG